MKPYQVSNISLHTPETEMWLNPFEHVTIEKEGYVELLQEDLEHLYKEWRENGRPELIDLFVISTYYQVKLSVTVRVLLFDIYLEEKYDYPNTSINNIIKFVFVNKIVEESTERL